MFVFNKFNTSTGTIIYENDQQLVSGLVSYSSPYRIETGCRFMVAKRNNFMYVVQRMGQPKFLLNIGICGDKMVGFNIALFTAL